MVNFTFVSDHECHKADKVLYYNPPVTHIHTHPPVTHIHTHPHTHTTNPTISNMQVHDHSSKQTTMGTILCQKSSRLAKQLSGTHHPGYFCCPKAESHSMADTCNDNGMPTTEPSSPSEKCFFHIWL